MLSTCKYTVNGVQRVGGNVLRIGTPKGYNHCYDTWMDGQNGREPDHKSWIYTSLQGGNIPESEIDVARRKMDPKTFRQEYEASFETYQGVIYYCFERTFNCTEKVVKKVTYFISAWTLTCRKWRQLSTFEMVKSFMQ